MRHGTTVQPETFTAVTILLCDIVSFTPLAASMKPMQVISNLVVSIVYALRAVITSDAGRFGQLVAWLNG